MLTNTAASPRRKMFRDSRAAHMRRPSAAPQSSAAAEIQIVVWAPATIRGSWAMTAVKSSIDL